jgi:subtilisin family serine protease
LKAKFRNFFAAALLLLTSVPLVAGAPPDSIRRAADPIPGSYIVVLQAETPSDGVETTARTLAAGAGGRVTAVMRHAIRAFGFSGDEKAALALSRNPLVAWVEEDGYLDLSSSNCSVEPGTTYVTCNYSDDAHWALDRIDQRLPIGSTKRFGYTYTGAGVRAYVVDTGVRGSHSEFGGRVTVGANMTVDPEIADPKNDPNEEDPIPLDYAPANNPCNGNVASDNWNATHGTGVASVLGGATVGVARGVTIVPVKVASCFVDEDGVQHTRVSMLATARGLDWILDDVNSSGKRAVVNISLRFVVAHTGSFTCEDDKGGYTNCLSAIEHEIRSLILNNIPVVVSAGNDEWDVSNDGMSRMGYGDSFADVNTITVGGTMYLPDYSDAAWSCDAQRDSYPPFTSCNRNSGSNFGAAVSIWAPAWNVRAASGFDDVGFRPTGIPSSGTSFAAPLVAGAVARLLEQYPSMTVAGVWQYLESTATTSTTPDFDQDPNVVNKKLLYISAYD